MHKIIKLGVNNIVKDVLLSFTPLDAYNNNELLEVPNTLDINIGYIYDPASGTVTKPLAVLGFLKNETIKKIKVKSQEKEPVTINSITFNGGNSSAAAINGAVALAKALGETDVKLWDINNNVATYSFDEAQNIAAQIAKEYRDKQLAKYTLIEKIKACTTVKELEAIKV